jgi:hypothetical protein
MFHLADDPTQEYDGDTNLDGVEFDLVEKSVRIEAAALHKSPFRLKRLALHCSTLFFMP